MSPAVTDSTIRAEIKRAWREGVPIDRRHLHRETGLPWDSLEPKISRLVRQMRAEASADSLAPAASAAKGADRATGVRPGRPIGPPVKRWRNRRKNQGE